MVRINPKQLLIDASIFILITFIFSYEIIRATLGNKFYLLGTVIATTMLIIFFLGNGKIYKKTFVKLIPWLIILGFYIFTNVDIKNGIYDSAIIFCCYMISGIAISFLRGWQDKLYFYVNVCGGIHVVATLVLFLFRGLYRYVYQLWGYYPTGTANGLVGYRAGITTHYSQNATYIAMLLIFVSCNYLTKEIAKRKKIQLIWIIIISLALMLTAKRAHLVFSIVSIVITYYICNMQRKDIKFSKLFMFGFIGIILMIVLAVVFPSLFSTLFSRFIDSGYDDVTSGRLPMWNLAIKLFLDNPIFGIGWYGYKYQYMYQLWNGYSKNVMLNTHNVYLQVLCELGIVGFITLTVGLVNFFILSKKLCLEREQGYTDIAICFGMGIFFVFYSFTGCCLYDLTFHLFFLCIALVISKSQKKG